MTDSDILKIMKIINEQKDKQFNEDEIDLLYWIFERELKPPFRRGDANEYGSIEYFDQNNTNIGWLVYYDDLAYEYEFIINESIFNDIRDKTSTALNLTDDSYCWFDQIYPRLVSWLGDQLNIKLYDINLM